MTTVRGRVDVRVSGDWTPPLNTPGLQLRKLSLVAVTPDHIDAAFRTAFALHAGKSALRLLLLLFNCSHTNLEPHFFFFFFLFFFFFFFIIF